jgi:hypothetical protein
MHVEPYKPLPVWLAPVLVVGISAVTLGAFWLGGRPGLGLVWAAINALFAVVFFAWRRSDAVRMLGGVDDDERTRTLDYQATTVMAVVLAVALAALFLASAVRGESGLVYGALLLLGETSRLTALVVLARRS